MPSYRCLTSPQQNRVNPKVVVERSQIDPTRRQLQDLADDLRASLPEIDVVVITPALALACLDHAGQALDLETLPFELMEKAVAFFGVGHYLLPSPTCQGTAVTAAFIPNHTPHKK